METLERISSLGSDRDQVYQGILAAKTDISELTPDDLILRDLKFESGVPFIGFPILIKVSVKMGKTKVFFPYLIFEMKKIINNCSRTLLTNS